MDEVLGAISELWRFPVKSMQGERIDDGHLTERGLEGDRRYALRDATTGKVLSAKRVAPLLEAGARWAGDEVIITLPDGTEVEAADPGADATLSSWLDRDVRLAAADPAEPGAYEMGVDPIDDDAPVIEFPCPPGTFLDAAAAHLLTTASLTDAAASHPAGRWDVRRFRPTMLVEVDPATVEGPFPEDAWIGAAVQAGAAGLMVFAPTVRCAMPTRAQGDLPRDADIARTVTSQHASNLGVYAAVTTPGAIAVGDHVRRT
ncbi:MOSC domain-containing protein [soil metagenome]